MKCSPFKLAKSIGFTVCEKLFTEEQADKIKLHMNDCNICYNAVLLTTIPKFMVIYGLVVFCIMSGYTAND